MNFGFSALIESCKTRTLGAVGLMGAFSMRFPWRWLSISLICFDLGRIHQNMHKLHGEHALFVIMNLSPDMTDPMILAVLLATRQRCFYTFATVEPNGYEVWWLQDGALLLPGMSKKPLERSQKKMSTKTLWDSIRHKMGDNLWQQTGSEDGMSCWNYCWWDLNLLVLDGSYRRCLLV